MNFKYVLNCAGVLLTFAVLSAAHGGLSDDDITLLQDSGGWEYLSLTDSENGLQTTHTCFDGTPHPEQCSGTLALNPSNTFVQNVQIHGQTVQRHGTYELDGNELSFFDELGTKDGPYSIELNNKSKVLVLKMAQVRIELELEKTFRDNQKKAS